MAHYAIGDVQGCYEPLSRLLDKIQFDPSNDVVWFVGDLVNRGFQSVEVLRLIRSLGDNAHTVLGNHDLHLLAVYHQVNTHREDHTFDDVLEADDVALLMAWLRQQPFMHYDKAVNTMMIHGGVHPSWSLQQALDYAQELQDILTGPNFKQYLTHMYGNQPDQWQENLSGWDRARTLTNYFTRIRYCHPDGKMNYTFKGNIDKAPINVQPWFSLLNPSNWPCNIVFGHWAALQGHCNIDNIFALDTGYIWGGELTAMRLDDQKRFSVSHPEH